GIFTRIVLIQDWPSRLLRDQLTNAADHDRCNDGNASGSCFQKHIGQAIVQTCIHHHIEPLWIYCVERTISAMPKQIGRFGYSIPQIIVGQKEALGSWEAIAKLPRPVSVNIAVWQQSRYARE